MRPVDNNLSLSDIIAVADEAYPDGFIGLSYNNGKPKNIGDTLALYIVRDLQSTYTEFSKPRDSVQEAIFAMYSARKELTNIIEALNDFLELVSIPIDELPLRINDYKGALKSYLEKRLKGSI